MYGFDRGLRWHIDNRPFFTILNHFLCNYLANIDRRFEVDVPNATNGNKMIWKYVELDRAISNLSFCKLLNVYEYSIYLSSLSSVTSRNDCWVLMPALLTRPSMAGSFSTAALVPFQSPISWQIVLIDGHSFFKDSKFWAVREIPYTSAPSDASLRAVTLPIPIVHHYWHQTLE